MIIRAHAARRSDARDRTAARLGSLRPSLRQHREGASASSAFEARVRSRRACERTIDVDAREPRPDRRVHRPARAPARRADPGLAPRRLTRPRRPGPPPAPASSRCSRAAAPRRAAGRRPPRARRVRLPARSIVPLGRSTPVSPGSSTPPPCGDPDATTGTPYAAASSTGRPRPAPWFGNTTTSSARSTGPTSSVNGRRVTWSARPSSPIVRSRSASSSGTPSARSTRPRSSAERRRGTHAAADDHALHLDAAVGEQAQRLEELRPSLLASQVAEVADGEPAGGNAEVGGLTGLDAHGIRDHLERQPESGTSTRRRGRSRSPPRRSGR